MGAPKQKWTAEEESALKAGIAKHGAGKWRTILKDPEFSEVLYLRSNVDLKDKWRNLSVTANGWGSREKARIALKKSRHVSKHDDNPMATTTTTVVEYDNDVAHVKPLSMSSEAVQISTPKRSESRLDNLILEAITKLKEPTGSSKIDIAMYIEDQYEAPANFKRLLSDKLKVMTRSAKLIKVKRKYRIAPSSPLSEGRSSKVLLPEETQREPTRVDKGDFKPLTKYQTDAELARMRNMTAQEAAAAAAQAVAEAEIAMAEAEEATREAEDAEAEYEEAQAFAEAAKLTLENRNATKQWAMQSMYS
ncbi:single myb histone 6-like [Iris pallida]|uniref:Single myb histone 6-like n=1 Tax=Iris pallida TaxID=29817 RepID=A0AAX6H268_IRIPA|nr:single myb histone 6-like [Iris pallida]